MSPACVLFEINQSGLTALKLCQYRLDAIRILLAIKLPLVLLKEAKLRAIHRVETILLVCSSYASVWRQKSEHRKNRYFLDFPMSKINTLELKYH